MNLSPIPSHKRFRISELCGLTKGSYPTLRTQPGDYPLVVTADFRRSADGWDITGPAVCIPLISSTGHGDAAINRVHYQEGRFALANLLVALTPKKDAPVIAKYLYFLLGAQKEKLLVPLMMGTANVSLKPKDIADVEIKLPPIADQQRIVELLDNMQQQLLAADKLRVSIDRDIASLLAVRFQETLTQAKWLPMSDVAPIVRREVTINLESNYTELGVRSFFKGAFIRRTVAGNEFTWQKLYQVNANDLIFSNIMAWEKGIALAGSEHDQCVGNHRMLTCEAKPEKTLAAFLHYYFTTDEGFAKVYAASPGTAARNRTLTANALMGLEVPIPPLSVQRQFVELKIHLDQIGLTCETQAEKRGAILPSVLNRFLG